MCVNVSVYRYMCVEARGQPQVSFSGKPYEDHSLRDVIVAIWGKYSQCRRMAIFGCHHAPSPKGFFFF